MDGGSYPLDTRLDKYFTEYNKDRIGQRTLVEKRRYRSGYPLFHFIQFETGKICYLQKSYRIIGFVFWMAFFFIISYA